MSLTSKTPNHLRAGSRLDVCLEGRDVSSVRRLQQRAPGIQESLLQVHLTDGLRMQYS